MTLNSVVRRRVLIPAVCITLLAASPAPSQISNPSEPFLSRGPWRDAFVLRGPGAQIGASVRNLTPPEAEQQRKSIRSVWRGVVVYELVEDTPPGWQVNITVIRDGRVRELTITPTL